MQLTATSAAFRIKTRCELVVSGYRRVIMSAPALAEAKAVLSSKDLISAGAVSSNGKFTLEEHLSLLATQGLLPPGRPLLVLGLRNNLVNPRAIAIKDGTALGVDGEDPRQSARPYFGIGLLDGQFVATSVLGPAQLPARAPEPFWAGVPVVWDGLSEDEILNLILTEASDHSHVFELHRGNHPHATAASRAAWQALHETFLSNLYSEVDRAALAMKQAVRRLPIVLKRSEAYLHSVLGVDEGGNLVNVIAHGRLEDLGRAASELGCRRAICVENSGSVMPTFCPEGFPGPAIPLLRAPNFRPKGRVLLVIELENQEFASLAAT